MAQSGSIVYTARGMFVQIMHTLFNSYLALVQVVSYEVNSMGFFTYFLSRLRLSPSSLVLL